MLITWEDKLHDKMTSVYSKSCGYKKFSVHTNTKKYRFRGSFYAYLVWTEAVSVTIKLRFQIYPA